MTLHRTAAVAQALAAVCLAAGATAHAFADEPENVGAVAAQDGGALFNPFVAASAPRGHARAAAESERPQGDWTLPLVAATAGFAGVGILMRKMIG